MSLSATVLSALAVGVAMSVCALIRVLDSGNYAYIVHAIRLEFLKWPLQLQPCHRLPRSTAIPATRRRACCYRPGRWVLWVLV